MLRVAEEAITHALPQHTDEIILQVMCRSGLTADLIAASLPKSPLALSYLPVKMPSLPTNSLLIDSNSVRNSPN